MAASTTGTTTTPTTTTAPSIYDTAATGINNAISSATQGTLYNPQQVQATGYNAAMAGSTGYNPYLTQAGQLSSTDMTQYMNPYTQNVIDSSLSDIEKSRQMAQNTLGAQASAAGAFGGSRQGVAESLTNAEYAQQAADTSAALRQAGYTNAQQMALQDIQNNMTASGLNQSALNTAGQFGASAANTASLANQSAQNAAQQYNAGNALTAQQLNQAAGLQGASQRLSAANTLGSLSNLGFGMGQTVESNLNTYGTNQQATSQALIDAAKAQYSNYANMPATSLSYLTSALGATPTGTTSTSTSTPGLMDYLTAGAGIAAVL